MNRDYFLQSQRLKFSRWTREDLPLAERLWGDPDVSRYICASGVFTHEEIEARLSLEIENDRILGIQYWPVFACEDEFAGCCGLRPHGEGEYELGIHLLPEYWHQGYASEAGRAAIGYAFGTLCGKALFAGHNPQNVRSRKVLEALGFTYIGDEFYPPTRLMHPSYRLSTKDLKTSGTVSLTEEEC